MASNLFAVLPPPPIQICFPVYPLDGFREQSNLALECRLLSWGIFFHKDPVPNACTSVHQDRPATPQMVKFPARIPNHINHRGHGHSAAFNSQDTTRCSAPDHRLRTTPCFCDRRATDTSVPETRMVKAVLELRENAREHGLNRRFSPLASKAREVSLRAPSMHPGQSSRETDQPQPPTR